MQSASMPAVVRVSREERDTRLQQVPVPTPGPGQILIAVEAAGICGTDVEVHHRMLPKDSRFQPPVVLGHEGAGYVAALGEGVCDLEIGQPVVAETTYSVCGRCRYCRLGLLNLCPDRRGLGSGVNGFFAPFTVVRHESVHLLPDGISTIVGSILEPFACAIHAVLQRAGVQPGELVVTFGPGPTGIMTSLVASLSGARSILVGTKHGKPRLQFVEDHGIAETFVIQDPDFSTRFMSAISEGADVVFECSGNVEAVEWGLKSLRGGGRLVVLGEIEEPYPLQTQTTLLQRELILTGSKSSIPSSWNIALELLPKVVDTLTEMVSHRFPLEKWREAFDLVARKEAIKVIFYFN